MILQILFPLLLMVGQNEKSIAPHPFFMSVTEIEFNKTEKTLEVSCKIFTEDFEKTLRMHDTHPIDLLNPKLKSNMNAQVENYIKTHLTIKTNGRSGQLNFMGFEQEEEATVCYFQLSGIEAIKTIEVFNDLLYEYSTQQINIVHAIVNKERKSIRLSAPNKTAKFSF